MLDRETIISDPLHSLEVDETNLFLTDAIRPSGLKSEWGLRLRAKLRPRPEGVKQFEFGLIVAGRAKLFVNGKLVIDNWSKQRQGQAFFGSGTMEEKGVVDVKLGESPEVLVEFSNLTGPKEGDSGGNLIQPAVRLGGRDVTNSDQLMESAVAAAEEADIAIVVVGLNADWESEGYDRTTLDLPGRTNELVAKVAAANKKTIVVTQSVSILRHHSNTFEIYISYTGLCNYNAMGRFRPSFGSFVVSR